MIDRPADYDPAWHRVCSRHFVGGIMTAQNNIPELFHKNNFKQPLSERPDSSIKKRQILAAIKPSQRKRELKFQNKDIPNETTDVIWIDEKENQPSVFTQEDIAKNVPISIKEVEVETVKGNNHSGIISTKKMNIMKYVGMEKKEYRSKIIKMCIIEVHVSGGNTSDRYITEHSGFLDLVSAGDEIMADRGFRIRDLLLERRAYLTMPPFTRKCSWGKGKRLTAYEIRKTRKIANVRIYVEQAIQRMKKFKMLSQILLLTKNHLFIP
ncbi:unnamed protein product [Mytilus edulis]|uniref:DDE Tnp4 domain-containing protein n=1 Tax=Mytilus edulis TaxID=6550 RepID=A0A8S3RW01_MYTED|nr:unnamed protein product [Mytilus edulis]